MATTEDKRRLPQFIDGKWAVQGSLPHFDDFGIQKEHRGDTIKRDTIENNPFKRRYVINAMFQVARMKEQEERAQAGSHKRPYAQASRHTAGPSNNNNIGGGRPHPKKRRRDRKDTGSRAKQTDPNDAEEGPMDEDNNPAEGEKQTEPAEEVTA
ncbi:hypothetical protein FA13DRAFT_1784873 [Coprinellus micaceus]|uniref:Uncharacterized protein n=1 Tax=Coprinellus micaceus TaxID=71717 RepID=A0A4Y7TWJ1_COPMI|nr:hypothetical protein FA13DRAFT_1784873 [Coprinellus micaceus]